MFRTTIFFLLLIALPFSFSLYGGFEKRERSFLGFKLPSERKQLSKAIQQGDRKKVKMLLKEGIPLFMPSEDEHGFTVFHEACFYQKPKIVKYLLKLGVDVNERIANDNMPLHSVMGPAVGGDLVAALQIIPLLVSCGAYVNGRGFEDATPLHLACVRIGFTQVMRELIGAGACLELHKRDGVTPLIMAAISENGEGLTLLIESGAKLENVCNEKRTALCNACKLGKVKSVEVLIEAGANVNAKGKSGETPLMMAAFADRVAIVELLLKAGADVHAKTAKKIEAKSLDETRFKDSRWDFLPWKNIPFINEQPVIPKKSTALDIARKFAGVGVEQALLQAGAK